MATVKRADMSVRSQSVVARVVAGKTLIVPVRAKVGDLASIYCFNSTGTLIWKLLESPKTVAELAKAVAQAYDAAIVHLALAVKGTTLGDAIVPAKSKITDPDVCRTFILFGDPATQIKQPGATPTTH